MKSLEKQISKQAIELKAIQEDLAKAKGALTSSRAELESLNIHLDEARAVAAAIDKTDKDEVIARLQKDLANVQATDKLISTTFSLPLRRPLAVSPVAPARSLAACSRALITRESQPPFLPPARPPLARTYYGHEHD